MKAIKLYWSASKPNVGDWLSPIIVGSQTSRTIEHALAKKCELMAIGSILHKGKSYWWSPAMDVWGSGFLHDRAPGKTKHRIHAVRGRLTKERIANIGDVALGDPGLLISSVLADEESKLKKHAVGVIPHYWDKDNAQLKRFLAKYPDVKFLDVFNGCSLLCEAKKHC